MVKSFPSLGTNTKIADKKPIQRPTHFLKVSSSERNNNEKIGTNKKLKLKSKLDIPIDKNCSAQNSNTLVR